MVGGALQAHPCPGEEAPEPYRVVAEAEAREHAQCLPVSIALTEKEATRGKKVDGRVGRKVHPGAEVIKKVGVAGEEDRRGLGRAIDPHQGGPFPREVVQDVYGVRGEEELCAELVDHKAAKLGGGFGLKAWVQVGLGLVEQEQHRLLGSRTTPARKGAEERDQVDQPRAGGRELNTPVRILKIHLERGLRLQGVARGPVGEGGPERLAEEGVEADKLLRLQCRDEVADDMALVPRAQKAINDRAGPVLLVGDGAVEGRDQDGLRRDGLDEVREALVQERRSGREAMDLVESGLGA